MAPITEPKAPLMETITTYDSGESIHKINSLASPHKRNFYQRFDAASRRLWLFEFICCFVSVATFLGLVAGLRTIDGKAYNGGPEKQLNAYAVISLLTVVMKAAMLVGIGTAIGQLRVAWYKRHRKLIDLDAFDGARGSIIGSFQLLLRLRFWHTASLGASITILALSIDALMTSSLQILPRIEPAGYTTLPIANNYTAFKRRTTGNNPGDQWPPTKMITAINFGATYLTGMSAVIKPSWAVNCPSGNCTFPRFQSLGIVSKCVIRDTIEENGHYQLKGYEELLSLDVKNGRLAINSTMGNSTQDVFGKIGPPITQNAMIFKAPAWTEPLGMFCALYWARHDNIGNISLATNFTLQETVLSTHPPTSITDRGNGFHWHASECWINGTIVQPKAGGKYNTTQCKFHVSNVAHIGLKNYFKDPTYGFVGNFSRFAGEEDGNNPTYYPSSPLMSTLSALMTTDRDQSTEMLEKTWSNIALFMTQTLRILQTDNPVTEGQQWRSETYYHVVYTRFILPGIIVLASLGFVLVTFVKTKKEMHWKNSGLPYLFLGLGKNEKEEVAHVRDFEEMERLAAKMDVRFGDGPEGMRFIR